MNKELPRAWWTDLRQNGLILSPTLLEEFLPDTLPALTPWRYEALRDAFTSFEIFAKKDHRTDSSGLLRWVDVVLEGFLGYDSDSWQKHTNVDERFTLRSSRRSGARLRPDRVLLFQGAIESPRLLVKIDTESKRVGMGRGRHIYSDFLELLRMTPVSIGLLTNGQQFRLVFAGSDYDCWVEWEASRWFEDAPGLTQLAGFKALLGAYGTEPRGSVEYPLLQAIQESRTRQGELSEVLGEQTRGAVEVLLRSIDYALKLDPEMLDMFTVPPGTHNQISEATQHQALYQATIRIIMRIVIALFAEARDLLPKDNEIYYASYSVEGLYAQLRDALVSEGEPTLDSQYQAWPRLLALFRLIAEGCDLPDLPIPAYGGGLFTRGDPQSSDNVIRAIALYEDDQIRISDAVVREILTLLKIGSVKATVGRSTRIVRGAVDFSDLRTEYIGMIYEGLLDYQLRKATYDEGAVIFLNLGTQPALPLSLLESLDDTALKDLIKKLGKDKADRAADEASGEEGYEEEQGEIPDKLSLGDEQYNESFEGPVERAGDTYAAIMAWAERAVEVAGLVKRPRKREGDTYAYRQEVEKRARQLIYRTVYPDEFYLVRASGTRKGSGTFYTKPQLAVPTVHRTLEPLVYRVEGEGEQRILTPNTPEEILSLKVCDPSMGSGSFLVGALRYLTDALYSSLWFYRRIQILSAGGAVVTLPFGAFSEGKATEEILPRSPDDERFESVLKARLKRYVVERCLYGVDINPLAVELGKLALWVETMDRELPFEFLDHKLKVGNSLVGCWLDQFQEYPLMAWQRETGDKGHNGVHFEGGAWTKAMKHTLDTRVKPELSRLIEGQKTLDYLMSDEDSLKSLFTRAVNRFEQIHAMPITDYAHRATFFQDSLIDDPDLERLKERLDLWCAVWFWPPEWLDDYAPTPEQFYQLAPLLLDRVRQLAEEHRFFHWELEFADVFVAGKGGFDAVIGNPPWETSRPMSQEFFSLYDPIYRTRDKQTALEVQRRLFKENRSIEEAWLIYLAFFKAMGNWKRHAGFPFGDPVDETIGGTGISLIGGTQNFKLHETWRKHRSLHCSYADSLHPFRYQGSAHINTYKMFLEQAHALCRPGGRLGFIVPSGIYTEKGSKDLRDLFLNKCSWEWIWSLINWNKLFPSVYYRFKFAVIVVEKRGESFIIQSGFNQTTFESWEKPYGKSLKVTREQIARFSPKSNAILETSSQRDLEILERVYKNTVLLGDNDPDSWGIEHSVELSMTAHSHLFPPRDWWEAKGYCPDPYGRWLPPDGRKPELVYRGRQIGPAGDIALPIYQGRMIGQFDFSNKGWVSGRGRGSEWREIEFENKVIEPQFLMSYVTYARTDIFLNLKAVIMDITSATNQRSMICAGIPGFPCGNTISVFSLQSDKKEHLTLHLIAVLNSIVYDTMLRMRLGGLHTHYFICEETPLPNSDNMPIQLALYCARLLFVSTLFSPQWLKFAATQPTSKKKNWKSLWAITPHERLRLRCIIDAVVSELYNLSFDDLAWVLRDCAHPKDELRERYHSLNPKGFWRVDKDKDPEVRHTVLSLKAFADLKSMGLEAFFELNNGDGWMIPKKLTYEVNEDGTITFDSQNGKTVSVSERLGPRLLDWQLAGTPEESWLDCETHARDILGEKKFNELIAKSPIDTTYVDKESKIEVTQESQTHATGKTAVNVRSVLKKAGEQKEDLEKKGGAQRSLGDW